MDKTGVDVIPKNTLERLRDIEFLLRFKGRVSRADIVDFFDIKPASASKDLAAYREIAKGNAIFDRSSKSYLLNEKMFEPKFGDFSIEQILSKLKRSSVKVALGLDSFDGLLSPRRLSKPSIDILSGLTRSIALKKKARITYYSVLNGESQKIIEPHAIFDSGLAWYVRLYDDSKGKFIDLILTRIMKIELKSEGFSDEASVMNDHDWNRFVSLELVPHPNTANVRERQSIELSHGMDDGCLRLDVRASVVGYWLRLWNVDCTEKASLEGYHYQLWLRNHNTLYDAGSRQIAPGLSGYGAE